MKELALLIGLFAHTLSLTSWFIIETVDTSRMRSQASIGGLNQEYVVQGNIHGYYSYLVDLEAGTSTFQKEMSVTDSELNTAARPLATGASTMILASRVIARLNFLQGQPDNLEKYSVEVGPANEHYYTPERIANSIYVLVASYQFTSNHKFYRLNPEVLTDLKEYTVGANSRAYGPIYGTNWILASTVNTDKRKIFDYTNGDVAGTDSTIAEHTKTAGSNEESVFMSPEDGRGYYVVSDVPGKTMLTIKVADGTQHLSHDLNANLGNYAIGLSWVYDTDLVLVAGWHSNIALYDFMDVSKSRPINVINVAETLIGRCHIWLKYRTAILGTQAPQPTRVYKIPVEDQPCSELCGTCHEVVRFKCVTCQPNASPTSSGASTCACDIGYYESQLSYTRKECLACSELCAVCTAGTAAACSRCKTNAEFKGDGNCGCKDGFMKSNGACLPLGGGTRPCDAGFFLKSSTCVSCAAETSADCPTATALTVQSTIQEFTRVLVLSFIPSLKIQFENANQASSLSVVNLLQNNLRITVGNNENNQVDVTVTETRMSHSGTAGNTRLPDTTTSVAPQTHSYVYVTFLNNLRNENSDYLKISLKSPWIYKPTDRDDHLKTIYLNEGWTQKIVAAKKVKSEEEKRVEEAARWGKDFTAGVGVMASAPTVIAFILAWTTNFLGSLIRLFNVANVVANMGKMNVKLAMNVNATFTIVENIRIPEWKFLGENSPIDDYEWSGKDRDAHQTHLRGTRGKITSKNDRVFLGSGQSFFISLIVLLLRFAVIPIMGVFLEHKNIVFRVVTFIYQLTFGVFFYQYQIICVAELAMVDYETIPDPQFRAGFFASLFLSIILLVVMIIDILGNFMVVKQLRKKKATEELQLVKTEADRNMNTKFKLDRYTRILNLDEKSNTSYYKMQALETLRFFVIQILIATLQLLNKTQAVLVFLANLAFFVYFLRALLTAKVYKNLFLTIKAAVLEVCLMILVTTMLVFPFAEDTDFQDSWLHKVLEQGAIMGILGAVGAEFANFVVELVQQVAVVFKTCQKLK